MTAADWALSADPQAMLWALFDAKFSTDRLPMVLTSFVERSRLTGLLSADLRKQFLAYAQWVFGLSPRPLPVELPVFDPLEPQGTDVFNADDCLRDAMTGGPAGWLNVSGLTLAEVAGVRRVASFFQPSGPDARERQRQQANALRDALGNPFALVTWEPKWRSETVIALATGIHFDNAFDRLPILADALEEAGCDHAEVLTHCRGPGSHARGCWVVDAARGK